MDVVTIGMLARNEAAGIGATIASLLSQTVFDPAVAAARGIGRIELMIVPNGCTDDTAAVATRALAAIDLPHVKASVRDQPQGGKSRTWNAFVHELAPADTSIFLFIDADIAIPDASVVERLIAGLRDWPDAVVTTSEPLKDFSGNARAPLQERFSRRASAQASDPHAICGQLYAARAGALRRIWLPVATPGEDGFLCAMVTTTGFTHPPIMETVRRVPGARHFYVPDAGFDGFVKHEARLLAGTAVNIYVFEHLWAEASDEHAGTKIRRWNEADPQWVDRIVGQRTRGRRWRLPGQLFFMRLNALRGRSVAEIVRRAPVAIAATLLSLPPNIRANRILGRSQAASHW